MKTVCAILVAICTFASMAEEPKVDPGAPGQAHAKLEPFVGSWSVKMSTWMTPGGEPVVSTATAENRFVMGGRYLEQRLTGNFMGLAFEGLGHTGYDNLKKKYWATWMDNFSTGMTLMNGDGDGKKWTFAGTMADPTTGKDGPIETRLRIDDADQHTMEMWMIGPGGKSFKSMEAVYTRRK